jgi:UDP-N-acetylmuramate dehydrogenase
MEIFKEKLKEVLGDKLQESVLLSGLTTIGVGGICDFFYKADSIEELVKAVNVAHKNKIPFFILGWGSNIVVSDYGFPGLVIKNESSNIVINQEGCEVIVDSGLPLPKLLTLIASNDLGGLEFMAGIPGTVGGAIYGNAGSKNYSISDYIKNVTLLELHNGKLVVHSYNRERMEFGCRSSKIKKMSKENGFQPVILTARFRLTPRRKEEIMSSMQENLAKKRASQPLTEKSAGCFFKNLGSVPEQAAGYLLDKSGAKKLKIGDAKVSKMHANFIINSKKATAREIRKLAKMASDLVEENFNIKLEEEIEYIGKW